MIFIVHLFGFFIAHSAAMHSKKSLNLIKNIYLVSLQNIMELSLLLKNFNNFRIFVILEKGLSLF